MRRPRHDTSTRMHERSSARDESKRQKPIRKRSGRRGRVSTKRSPDSDMDYRWDSLRLTSSRPGHTGVPTRCTRDVANPAHSPVTAPLSTELWHCTAYPENLGSHLGSTLKPGGAVLTLGVFRHLRSVACIRADASPSEVLAPAIVPPASTGVNSSCRRTRNMWPAELENRRGSAATCLAEQSRNMLCAYGFSRSSSRRPPR